MSPLRQETAQSKHHNQEYGPAHAACQGPQPPTGGDLQSVNGVVAAWTRATLVARTDGRSHESCGPRAGITEVEGDGTRQAERSARQTRVRGLRSKEVRPGPKVRLSKGRAGSAQPNCTFKKGTSAAS